ncbi:hypothetical protein AEGHOMDF_0494 [Methylobacterium soli]|nr:hypothetical protein AEGHOMDF_0494 [Methylobacterium soli]
MITAEHEIGLVRPNIVASVKALQDRGLSRMEAYAVLGSMLGKSQTWVRKVIGRQPDAAIYLRDALNIRSAYDRLCARIDAASERIEGENDQLREAIDVALSASAAPHPGRPGPTQAQAAAPRGAGPPAAPALVRPRARTLVPADQPSVDVNDLPLWRAIEGE